MDIARELGFSDTIIQQVKQKAEKIQNLKVIGPNEGLKDIQSRRIEAIELNKDILSLLKKSVDKLKLNDHRYSAIIAEINTNIARILVSAERDNREYGEGNVWNINEDCQEYFNQAESYLTALEAHVDTFATAIFINNEMGNYNSMKQDFQRALKYLKKAEAFYQRYDENINNSTIYQMSRLSDFFLYEFNEETTQTQEVSDLKLMKLHNNETNKYFSTLYCQMDLRLEALEYKFKELNTSLELGVVKERAGLDWLMQVASSASIFLREGCYEQVNYCLCVAKNQLNRIGLNWDWSHQHSREITDIRIRICDIETQVVITFLAQSATLSTGLLIGVENDRLEKLKKLKLPLFEEREENFQVQNIIPNKPVSNYDGAKELFLKILRDTQERRKREDIKLNIHSLLECDQWISQAYMCLSGIDEQADRRAKMHQRRIDLFEKSKKEFYTIGDEKFKNLVCHDLGDAYTDLLDTKLCQLLKGEIGQDKEIEAKVNHLRSMAILNYKQVLDFERKIIGRNFKKSNRSSRVLESCRRLAQVYLKALEVDVREFIEYMKLALMECKYYVDFCESDPTVMEDVMGMYFLECRQMVRDLSHKIAKMENDPESFDLSSELIVLFSGDHSRVAL